MHWQDVRLYPVNQWSVYPGVHNKSDGMTRQSYRLLFPHHAEICIWIDKNWNDTSSICEFHITCPVNQYDGMISGSAWKSNLKQQLLNNLYTNYYYKHYLHSTRVNGDIRGHIRCPRVQSQGVTIVQYLQLMMSCLDGNQFWRLMMISWDSMSLLHSDGTQVISFIVQFLSEILFIHLNHLMWA